MARHPIQVKRVYDPAEGPVTLLFSARDEQHNQAVALRRILDDGESTDR